MPEPSQHRSKADRFLQMYDSLPADGLEGKAIALFYCAVHIVEMVSAELHGVHPRVHHDRKVYINKHHGRMWKHYKPLHDTCWDARYTGSQLAMSADQMHEQLRIKRLSAIEKWAVEQIGDYAKLPSSETFAASGARS